MVDIARYSDVVQGTVGFVPIESLVFIPTHATNKAPHRINAALSLGIVVDD